MAWTVREVVAARETFGRLLEELQLADHLFAIEPAEGGWKVRVECRSRGGSTFSAFGIEAGVLERCNQDRGVRRRLRRFVSERLGDCVRRARPSVPPPAQEPADDERPGADLSTLAAMSEYSSTAGGSQLSAPAVLVPEAAEHAMSHVEAPDPVRSELYWYALEQATQDPHPPESDLPPAEVAALHVVSEDEDDPRGGLHARRARHGDAKVSTIMTRDVGSVPPSAPIAEVRERFQRLALEQLPVTDGERLIGMIASNDVLRLGIEPLPRSRRNGRLLARDLMHAAPVSVRENDSVQDAAATLCDGMQHALPVVDAEQRLVGMVTSSDLLRVLSR